MEWLNDGKDSQWNCEYCKSRKLDEYRNCNGNSESNFRIKIFDEIFNRCPISLIDNDAWEVANIILMCEGSGMSGMLPSQVMEETNFWWNARNIVIGEYNRINSLKEINYKDK